MGLNAAILTFPFAVAAGLAAGLAAASLPLAALAQTSGAVFVSADYGRDWSASAGAVLSPATTSGGRWALRTILAAGEYDYDAGSTTIEADYLQAEAVLLRQWSGSWGYLNVGAGARHVDTKLRPSDPGNDRNGGRWDGVITADGVRGSGPWETGGYAAYGLDDEEYYLRARLTRRIGSERFRLGIEALAQGDRNYDRQGVSALAMHRSGGFEWTVSAGGRGGEGQISVGLVRSF